MLEIMPHNIEIKQHNTDIIDWEQYGCNPTLNTEFNAAKIIVGILKYFRYPF